MKYIVGSDRKTAEQAKAINDKVNALLTDGDFVAAERLVDVALSSPNIPFRMEFLHQVETCAF